MSRRRTNPGRFAAVYVVLMVAHDLGDHVAQTHRQALGKGRDGREGARAMVGHVGSYTAVQVAALTALRMVTGVAPSWRRVLAGVVFSAATHAWWDRGWTVRWVLDHTGSADFRGVIPEQQVQFLETPIPEGQRLEAYVPECLLPLHGPYLADQALHHGCLIVAAGIIAGGRRG